MKDKYFILNDTKINLDKYKNINTNDINKKEVKGRLISKLELNNKKPSYSKFIKVATITLILTSSILILSEDVQALMLRIGSNIESFLNKDKNELYKYKTVVNQNSSSSGVDISLNEVMFNNDELLLNLNIDVSEYTKNNLEKFEKCIVYPMIFKLNLDGKETYALTKSISVIESSDNTVDYLLKTELGNVDLIKNYSKHKNIDLEIETKDLWVEVIHTDEYKDITESTSKMVLGIMRDENNNINETLKKLYEEKIDDTDYNKILGKWSFNTNIDVSKSISDTRIWEVNKSIDVNYKGFVGKIIIDKVSISPATVKVSYRIKANDDCNVDISQTSYLPLIDIKNQYGIKLEELSSSGYDYDYDIGSFIYENEYILKSNDKKLIITPGIDFFSRIYFDDSKISIELE